ncbi:MAG: hypothetical protein ABEJ23_09670 [Haloarculaceae archaeon]
MFDRRDLSPAVESIRDEHAPGALVLDAERDFETLDPAVAETLLPLVESLDPVSYPESWLPPDAPEELFHYAGSDFVIGMPGDGGVAWTTQTVPPTVFVKPRLEGAEDSFVDFLVAEALVEAGLGVPEHFVGFFEDGYRDLAAAVPLNSADTYQLAVALYDASVGLCTRPVFESWADDHPDLHAAWQDAARHLEPRLGDLPREVAAGRLDFAPAAELACNALKHGMDLPAPFAALDAQAYRERGAPYAVAWAETTFERLHEDGADQ